MCRMNLPIVLAFAINALVTPTAEPAAQSIRACLTPSETRAAIARHRLVEPLGALRSAARKAQAEPLRSRLCRRNGRFVYEMALLRRDGRVVRVFLDAASGAPIAGAR